MSTLGFNNEREEMLHEAGFEPCYVKDLDEGDTIAINHEAGGNAPTEMVVTSLWETNGSNPIRHWLGALPTGRKVHCAYHEAYPCWRRPDD